MEEKIFEGYYNNKKCNISVVDDGIKIDKKVIKYDDIYAIREDLLYKYIKLYPIHIFFAAFFSGMILSSWMFGVRNTMFMVVYTIIVYVLIELYKRNIRKKLSDDYFKVYDIYYENRFDTILLRENDDFQIDYKKLKKIKNYSSRVLAKYEGRVKKTREYLFKQIESRISTGAELEMKYATVAIDGYSITQNFDYGLTSYFERVYNEKFGDNFSKTAKLLKINIALVVVAIILFLDNWEYFSILG